MICMHVWNRMRFSRLTQRAQRRKIRFHDLSRTSPHECVIRPVSLQELDLRDAGGRILGYQVSYELAKKKKKKKMQHGCIKNVTEVTALLVVEEGNCSVTVAAYNAAGYGPAARLSIDPQRRTSEWHAVVIAERHW